MSTEVRATMGGDTQGWLEQFTLGLFIVVPFAAIFAAVPIAWGGWLGWTDIAIAAFMYVLTLHGVTVGFHRLFTHRSFKPNRVVKNVAAIVGSMAIEGPLIRWVADHRKHHQYADDEGDPHSPWRYGPGAWSLTKGLWWAHMGWLFDGEQTPIDKYAKDLVKDRDLVRISRLFWLWSLISLGLPPVIGFAVGGVHGALTAFFWGSLVRVGLLHHATWSINSICHVTGSRPFASRDRAGNVWWLALFSGGESWHNLHHADPTSARHGVLRGQIDTSARVIWLMEKFGWVSDVRWPTPERLNSRLAA